MHSRLLMTAAAAVLTATMAAAVSAEGVVTIYSADGLHDGSPNWYQHPVRRLHQGDRHQGAVHRGRLRRASSQRVAKEQSNPQADVLVTLPPFIQKAAADGLLQPYTPAEAEPDPGRATRTRRAPMSRWSTTT